MLVLATPLCASKRALQRSATFWGELPFRTSSSSSRFWSAVTATGAAALNMTHYRAAGQQGGLTIERMCILTAVIRAGYYRFCTPRPEPEEEESRLRDAIQRAALESRHYGYRRVTRALRAQGWEVNHKRIARLMREDSLLAIRKRRFVPQTTDSRHDLEVAVNIARQLILTAINQLWVADITYVRLGHAVVFLDVVM